MKMKLISTIHIYTGQRSYRQYREKQTCYVDDNLTTSHFIEETTNQKLGMLTCKSFRQKRCKWSCAEERKHVNGAVQRTIDRYLLSKTPSKWSTGGQHKKRYTQNSVTVYIAYIQNTKLQCIQVLTATGKTETSKNPQKTTNVYIIMPTPPRRGH